MNSIHRSDAKAGYQNGDGTTGARMALDPAQDNSVGGRLVSVSKEFTRPANTTGYTAGDIVSDNATTTTIQELTNVARANGGSGYITGARLATDMKSITPKIRVHLYSTIAGAIVSGDNLPHKSIYADIGKRLGYFDLPAMITGTDATNSTSSGAADFTLRIPFVCDAASRNLYFVLETLDAFTPASGQKFTLTIAADLN